MCIRDSCQVDHMSDSEDDFDDDPNLDEEPIHRAATLDMTLVERYGYAVPTHPDYPYVARVHAAGGWKRYEQAHIMRLAPIFSKIFPQSRLPHEMVAHVVSFWAHVGHY